MRLVLAEAKLLKRLLICVLCKVSVGAVARLHKGLLICVLCNVTAVGGGKYT